MPTDDINFFIPEENKGEFDRLFNERNNLMIGYGRILKMIIDIKPSPDNYEKCKFEIKKTGKYVEEWGNAVIKWINDASAYELNLNYQYEGTEQQNFQFLNFKLLMQKFIFEMYTQREFILKGFNDKSLFNKGQENVALSRSMVGKISKFAKNHPFYFWTEVIIHSIAIMVALKEVTHFIVEKIFVVIWGYV